MNDKNNSSGQVVTGSECRRQSLRKCLLMLVTPLWAFGAANVLAATATETTPQKLPSAKNSAATIVMDEMVVTARRSPEDALRLIGQVAKVSEQDLEEVGHTHLQEVAVRLPGVWLSRGNGQEMLASVRSPVYTGAGSCGEVLVAEDGLSTRPSGLCNVNQLFEVNTEQASGLEVLRGPGSVFYGANAVHGVINSLSPSLQANYVAVEHGPHQYWRTKLGVGGESNNQRVWVAANGVSDGGAKADSGFDQQKLSVKHQLNAGLLDETGVATGVEIETLLSLVNLNQETAGYIRGFQAYEQAGWEANSNPEAYRDAHALRLSSRVSGELSGNRRWSVRPYVRQSEMQFLQHYLPGQPEERNEQKSVGVQASLEQRLSDQALVWFGADVEWADMAVAEYQQDTFISGTNARYQGQHYDFSVESQQLALYGNLAWQFSERLHSEFGLRWEGLSYDYDNRMIDGSGQAGGSGCGASAAENCRYFRPSDRNDDFSNVSGHLGLNFALHENLVVYGRVARAYRAPQINERYRLLAGQSVDEFGDKAIDSLETGVRYRAEKFQFDVSGYWMQKRNVILKASNNATVGDAKTEHKGLELQAAYQLLDSWRLTSALSWSEHRVKQASDFSGGSNATGLLMDTAPEWSGSVQLRYQPSSVAYAELEAVYMDDYYLDATNEHEYAGHKVLNALVGMSLADNWQGRLRIQNLTNKRFAERADYAFGSYRYFTGESRGVFAEVKKTF